MRPGGKHQVADIGEDRFVDPDLPDGRSHRSNLVRSHDRGDPVPVDLPVQFSGPLPAEDLKFPLPIKMSEDSAEHEPVALGLDERKRPLRVVGVLGSDDEIGVAERVGCPIDRRLPLAQGLEEGALGLRGQAVHLIDHQEVREDRAFLEDKITPVSVVDPDPDDICRLEIHGPLDPSELTIHQPCDDLADGGLCGPWHPFNEEMAAADHADEDLLDERLVCDNHLLGDQPDLFVSVCDRFDTFF